MLDDAIHEEELHKKLNWSLWRRVIAHAKPYKPQLIGLGVSGLLVAAVDAAMPYVTGRLVDVATAGESGRQIAYYSAAYASLVVVICVTIWLFIVLAGQVATGLAYDIREKSFARLQELEFAYYDHRPVGWLMSRLTSDCTRLSGLIPWMTLDVFWGTCMIASIVGMMFYLNWQLALVVLTIVPPLAVISIVFQTKLLHSSRAVRKVNSQITAGFNECLMGAKTTKTLVREEENLGEFQHLTGDMRAHSVRNALQSAVYLPLVLSIGSVGVGLALWRGGATLGESVSLGTLIAFMQYAALFYIPIQELARRFTEVQMAQAAAERIQGLLDTEPAIKDSPEVAARLAAQEVEAKPGVARDGYADRIEHLEFKSVSFAYKDGERVLSDFDLTVEAGDTVALVGPTGGGKSTIVSLLCRFYEPTEGVIAMNGVDYRDRSLHWLQSNLGMVLQAPHLFSGTVKENIRYGRLDASDEEIVEAAKVARAHEFISDLEDGYDTEVGEGGGQLSTGQKQLVSLARAVLADPQIFVMDEATSSVDTETERLIQEGIERLLEGRLAFVIAHRLSTIRSADRILVVEGGEIVEAGRHEELIALGGKYYDLYTHHFSEEKQEEVLSAD
ncbi:MAG: ABC transporter ATP-binding protein [Phycisphaerales bacterium JB038]